MSKSTVFILLAIFFTSAVSAQQFGAFPPNTRWRQINTDTMRIIYTGEAKEHADRIASVLQNMAATNNPLGNKLSKINIVLHNRTTLANGYVGLAPFRSEFYLVPGSNIFNFGNLPWSDQLAVHEYRHVQQFNNFNRGLSRTVGLIFGEESRALANALAIPDWFFEGDAVYAETALTTQGRGRMPYFLSGYNSLWKEGKNYSWMKLRNGSVKHYVPNHYQLGYLLVNYGYMKYGEDFWRKVTQDAAGYKGLFYPFQKAVKRHSGVAFKTFRTEALKYYSHQVARRRDEQQPEKMVVNYLFPTSIGKDSLIYLKTGFKKLPAFYIRQGNEEKKISLRNISSEDWLSYSNGLIAYTSFNTKSRWSLVDFSDIILLDTRNGSQKRITTHKKYFTPSFSPDGSSLIATSVNDSLQMELHWMDLEGRVKKSIAADPLSIFVNPVFLDQQNVVVGLRHPDATITLQKINLENGRSESLLPRTKSSIGFSSVKDGVVYFVSSFSGNDDIYALRLKEKKLFQLTTGQTGHYFPSVNNDTLSWSLFTSNGFSVRQSALKDLTWQEVDLSKFSEQMSAYEVANVTRQVNILNVPEKTHPDAVYKKGTGLLNFHSWRPSYEEPELQISFYSDNILNTFSNEVFYRYNENETSHTAGFNTAYAGWFPLISAGAEHTFERHLLIQNQKITVKQSEARIGFSFPLNFTQKKFYRFLNAGTNFVVNRLSPTGASVGKVGSSTTTYLHHFISWSQQLPRARQHIFPHFGYAVFHAYRHELNGKGKQYFTNGQIYLPSFAASHSLVLGGSFQVVDTSNVVFSNRFVNARGYVDHYFYKMWRGSANYHFPLIYPDFGVANIVYLLRVRSNVFYDHAKVFFKDRINTRQFNSVGTEFFFDTKWWNQLPVSFGFRVSHLLDNDFGGVRKKGDNFFEVIVPVGLIPD